MFIILCSVYFSMLLSAQAGAWLRLTSQSILLLRAIHQPGSGEHWRLSPQLTCHRVMPTPHVHVLAYFLLLKAKCMYDMCPPSVSSLVAKFYLAAPLQIWIFYVSCVPSLASMPELELHTKVHKDFKITKKANLCYPTSPSLILWPLP